MITKCSQCTVDFETFDPRIKYCSSSCRLGRFAIDRNVLIGALRRHHGNVAAVAREMNIHHKSLRRHVRKHGLSDMAYELRQEHGCPERVRYAPGVTPEQRLAWLEAQDTGFDSGLDDRQKWRIRHARTYWRRAIAEKGKAA